MHTDGILSADTMNFYLGQRLTTSLLCLPSDKATMHLSTDMVIADNESLVKTMKG